jgi:hypothetical protein
MLKFDLNNIAKLYITIISYPSVIKLNNLKQLFILMILIISTLILTTGIIENIKYELIKIIIINFTILYFLFIIINLIVRIYNMLVRVAHYFLQNIHLDRRIIIGYYFYNLLGLLLTTILLYRLEFSMIQYDPTIINYIYIYIFFSLFISLIYIDYISGLEFNIKKINVTKFTRLFICFNFSLLFICLISAIKITMGEFIINDKELLLILAKFNIIGGESSGSGSLNQNPQEIKTNQGEDMELESNRSKTPVPDTLLHGNNKDTVNTVSQAPRGRSLQRPINQISPWARYINNLTPYITEFNSVLINQRWIFLQYNPGIDIASLDLQIEMFRRAITYNIISNYPISAIIEGIHLRQLAEFKRIVTIESMYVGIPLRFRHYYPPLFGYSYNNLNTPSHLDRPENWPALRSIAEESDLESQLKLHKYKLKLFSPLKYHQLYSSLDLPQSRANIPLLDINNYLPK